MTKKPYLSNGSIKTLDDAEAVAAVHEAEKTLRSGKFSYVDKTLDDQVSKIKESWPVEAREFLRNKAREIAAPGPIDGKVLRKAIHQTLEQIVVPARTKVSGSTAESEYRQATGETALSLLLKEAPDANLVSFTRRNYPRAGKTMKVRTLTFPQRLVVDCSEIDGEQASDIYVLACYVPASKSAVLVGWQTKEDMKAKKKGNKTTDPDNCSWSKMAYYAKHNELRPMTELMSQFGISEATDGILIEKPAIDSLPLPTKGSPIEGVPAEQYDALEAALGKEAAAAIRAKQEK